MQKKIKLENKFILLIILFGIIGFTLLGRLTYAQVSRIIIKQNKDDALGIVATAAKMVDGDAFARITSPRDEEYRDIYKTLSDYRVNNLITYIYAMRQEGDHLVFVVDTDTEDPAGFLEEYPLCEGIERAYAGEVCADTKMTRDRWGEYFSAYAPIVDSQGNVVGIIGVDILSETIEAVLGRLRNMVMVLITVFSAFIIIVYSLMSRHLIGRNMQTEIANYDSLIKRGAILEKKNQLSQYSGIVFNIKDFKYVNQKVGARAGDEVLRLYAQSYVRRMKKGDYIFGTGGDNFFALVKKGREQEFLDAMAQKKVELEYEGKKQEISIAARAGIYPIRENDNIYEAMNCSTLALNEAKAQANLDYQWFEDDMFDTMIREKEILNLFPDALAGNEFVVYYQPKVNIENDTLYGAEALVRWFREDKMISPGVFIPVLEKNNMITELDFYVFEQVCKNIRKWCDEGIGVVRISSNFSKLHLKNPYFAEEILDIMEKYEINPKYIDIELTESSGFYDQKALNVFVEKMNEAGVAVSIDDFGTGYSSLSLLKELDVEVVKMDKTFFDGLESGDDVDRKMVQNVIQMVQDLGKDVVCEGIETENQKDMIKSYHAKIVQGYYYDKPLPRGMFEQRLMHPLYENKECVL